MLSKFTVKEFFIFLIALAPLGYLAYVYQSLAEIIPIHFDLSGRPNGFGSKRLLTLISLLLSLTGIGLYVLIKFLPMIDPKKTAKLSAGNFQKIAVAMVVFLTAFNIILIHSSLSGSLKLNRLFIPLLGLFFIYIGNFMHSIKPNYFIGIRVPWTLEDPDNWRATHQLGGKIWVAGGAFIVIASLVLPANIVSVLFLATLALMVMVPVCFSFIYFKKK